MSFRFQNMSSTALVAAAIAFPSVASAQSTGAVAGPGIKDGETQMELRLARDLDADQTRLRLHVQHGFSDLWRGRIVVEATDAPGQETELALVRGEVLRALTASHGPGLTSSVQVSASLPVNGRGAGQVGLASLNSWDFENGWQWRGFASAAVDIGDEARNGASLGLRTELTAPAGPGVRWGGQVFSSLGRSGAMGDFNDQSHWAGPVVKLRASDRTSLEASAHLGLSQAAPDAVIRVFAAHVF